LIQRWQEQRLQFTVAATQGDISLVPAERTYNLVVHGIRHPDHLQLLIRGQDRLVDYTYDEVAETLSIVGIIVTPTDELTLTCGVRAGTLLSHRDRRLETCRKMLRAFRLDTAAKHQVDQDLLDILDKPALLMNHSAYLADSHLAALSSVIGQ